MSHVITCPSGITGRIRGMKVREERILTDRKLSKSGGQLDELLAACWEELAAVLHEVAPLVEEVVVRLLDVEAGVRREAGPRLALLRLPT
jgi:hypothetical protein